MNKCIHNEHPRNCGICEDIHALENLVESLKIENSVLRNEVKAWRDADEREDMLFNTLGEQDRNRILQAITNTDNTGALEDER